MSLYTTQYVYRFQNKGYINSTQTSYSLYLLLLLLLLLLLQKGFREILEIAFFFQTLAVSVLLYGASHTY